MRATWVAMPQDWRPLPCGIGNILRSDEVAMWPNMTRRDVCHCIHKGAASSTVYPRSYSTMFIHFPSILIYVDPFWLNLADGKDVPNSRQKQHNIIHQQHWKRASLLNFDLVWSLLLCLLVSSWLCKPWGGQSVKALWLTVSGQHFSQRIDRHMCNELHSIYDTRGNLMASYLSIPLPSSLQLRGGFYMHGRKHFTQTGWKTHSAAYGHGATA